MNTKFQENKLLFLAQIELLLFITYSYIRFFMTPALLHFLALANFLMIAFLITLPIYIAESKNKFKLSALSAFILFIALGFWLGFMPRSYNILNNLLIALPIVLILLNTDEVKRFLLEGESST